MTLKRQSAPIQGTLQGGPPVANRYSTSQPTIWDCTQDTKTCKRCKIVRLLSAFGRVSCPRNRNGHRPLIPDSVCRQCNAEIRREWRKKNLARDTANQRKIRLRHSYGITEQQYLEMLKKQKGVCAICGKPETTKSKRTGVARTMSVDHDHRTGIIRGLLCFFCNHGLGNFRDSPDALRAAAAYIERGPA